MARTTRTVLSKLLSVLMLVGMLLTALSIAGSPPVMAQTAAAWTTVGAAGTVDNDDLALYATDDGTGMMFFANGVNGTLNVKYNIDGLPGLTNALVVRYRDNGNSARVILQLRRYGLSSGVTSDPLVTLDSNIWPASDSFETGTICTAHNFDFENYAYYINAIITKSAGTGNPALGAIKMGTAGNCT